MLTVEQLYNRCLEMLAKYGSQGYARQLKVRGIGELLLIGNNLSVRFAGINKNYPFNITQQHHGNYPDALDWLNNLPDLLDRMEARIKAVESLKSAPIPVANSLQLDV
jgi:hypothetical protein